MLCAGNVEEKQLAAFGFLPNDFNDDIEVWECNADAFYVFRSMGTQWRIGMAGATGLDYAAMPVVMDAVGVRRKRRTEVFASVQIMEQEALVTWAEERKDD